MPVAGLILAAGRATRFGADKRQARLPDGQPVLATVLRTYARVCAPLVVVLRADDALLAGQARALGVQVAHCEDADEGLGHSLARGARALSQAPTPGGVLIGLADMPGVRVSTLLALREALLARGEAVLPCHRGRAGHPRGLPAHALPTLCLAQGDEGARHLVDWASAWRVDVDDPGVLLDIDTPSDLLAWPAQPGDAGCRGK